MRHGDHGTRPAPRLSQPPRPSNPTGLDPAALTVTHDATRALLAATSPREAVDVVLDLVTALGATVVPARAAAPDTLPLDLSFGVDEPLLAQADPAGIPRLHLEILLPTFLEDARRVVMALRNTKHLRDEATTDPLTGLLNRHTWDRQLHRLARGDTITMLSFPQFKRLVNTAGPAAGDTVLASFGRLLRQFLDSDDLAARYDPHHIVMGTHDTAPHLLAPRLDQLRRLWEAIRPHPVTFSAALTAVTTTAINAVEETRQALATAAPQ